MSTMSKVMEFLKADAEQWERRLGARLHPEPPVPITEREGSNRLIEVMYHRMGRAVVAAPVYADRIRSLGGTKEMLKRLDDENALDWVGDQLRIHTLDDTKSFHSLGLLCHADSFRPHHQPGVTVTRVQPGDPLWPEDAPPFWAFGHVVTAGGEVVASSHAGKGAEGIWTTGAGVKAPYRRQGLGSAVVSATVSEVVRSGRIALWVTDSTNRPSLRTAERLGFETYYRYLVLTAAK